MHRREFLSLAAASAAASALSGGNAAGAQALPAPPGRLVLEGVPYVGDDWGAFLDGPQDLTFPSCMRAVMEHLGEPAELNYRFFLSVCGLAYRQLWRPDGWDCAFDNVFALSEDPAEGVRRCMDAAGYSFAILGNKELCAAAGLREEAFTELGGPESLLAAAVESLQANRPFIAFGMPVGACAIVAGLDEGGSMALCYGMCDQANPPERDPLGYWRVSDWLSSCQGVIILGDRVERQPLADACREAVLWAVQAARTERIGEYACGQAAFEAWLAALSRDEDLSLDDPDMLRQRMMAHFFITLTIAEGRAFAGELLALAADGAPEAADDLYAAEFSYHIMHDLVWRLWQTADGTGGADAKPVRFVLPEVREHLREIVTHMALEDATAVAHLETALLTMGVEADRIPPPVGMAPQPHGLGPGVQPASLGREGVNIWAPNVPRLAWAQDRDCCFIGALEAALAPTDHPVSYAWLMGVSGLAFRTRWFHNPTRAETPWGDGLFHPVSPHGEQPEVVAAISAATGWRLRVKDVPEDPEDFQRHRLITDILMSVNEGLPVVTGLNSDLACVYGYHIHSMNLIVRDYQRSQEDETRIHANDPGFHSPFVFLEGHDSAPPAAAAVSMGIVRALADRDRADENGFRYGLAALDAWCEAIASYDDLAPEERQELFMVNWWTLMHLSDARRACVEFLEAADAVPAPVLEAYREVAQVLSVFMAEHSGLIPWWGGRQGEADWGADLRAAQIALLQRARSIEEAALDGLG